MTNPRYRIICVGQTKHIVAETSDLRSAIQIAVLCNDPEVRVLDTQRRDTDGWKCIFSYPMLNGSK